MKPKPAAARMAQVGSTPLYTVGHSTRSLPELIDLLRAWDITRLVDIRAFPRSRTNPQFNSDVIEKPLADAGLSYVWLSALAGRRGKSKTAPPTENDGWQVQAFHNYADYAATVPFLDGLEQLLAMAFEETCAIMCAEAVWWRCHRRIVADYVLARGVPVIHLFTKDKSEPAKLTPFARVEPSGVVSYPAEGP